MTLTTILSLAILGQATLPGSNASLEEARDKATIIVVAEPGPYGLLFGVGASSYGTVDLKPSTVLKGDVGVRPIKTASLGASGNEEMPEVGTEYIFFLYEYKGHPQVHKVLPKTDKNLEEVKRAIEAKKKP